LSVSAQELEVGCSIAPNEFAQLNLYSDEWTRAALGGETWRGAGFGHSEDPNQFNSLDANFLTALGQILVGLSNIYGERPSFEFYDDADRPNAKASTRTLREVPGTKGSVVFGVTMLQRFLAAEGGDMAIFAVCAHEFGHIYQFHNDWHQKISNQLPDYCVELHADYLAGFCMGHYTKAYPSVRIREVGPAWEKLGSSGFNNPGTHGTSKQRLDAIEAGYFLVDRWSDATVADAAAEGFEHVQRYQV
jgi:hypothetical protein